MATFSACGRSSSPQPGASRALKRSPRLPVYTGVAAHAEAELADAAACGSAVDRAAAGALVGLVGPVDALP
jgi:hypothetical protein